MDNAIPIWKRLLLMILAVGFTLCVHELIHFIFARMFGKKDAEIRFAKSPMGFPTLGVFGIGELPKWQRIIVWLAPFAILTVLLDVIFFYSAEVHFVLFLIALSNCAGCFYDIVDVLIMARTK